MARSTAARLTLARVAPVERAPSRLRQVALEAHGGLHRATSTSRAAHHSQAADPLPRRPAERQSADGVELAMPASNGGGPAVNGRSAVSLAGPELSRPVGAYAAPPPPSIAHAATALP